MTFEYNDTKYSLNDFPILEAKKCDSLSIEVGLNNKKIPVTFSYINFDYSDLDIKTEISIDSVVMDIQKKEIYFFLNGNIFFKTIIIHLYMSASFSGGLKNIPTSLLY